MRCFRFAVISVPSSRQHNGWVIPPSWDVEEARIVKDGRTIYDGSCPSSLCDCALAELLRHG